jgi:anaerobic magnesium-protoporphyrin IX monomethyl ester cyclase
MKITLLRYHDEGNINTRLPESLNKNQGVLPPLGLAYIAGALEKAGHEIMFIDAVAENLTRDEVRKKIKDFKTQIVGVTCLTPTILGALEACEISKECGAIVIIGGVHLEVYPKETLSYNFIDYGIIGEGEETVVELVDTIENNKPVNNILGIAYKENNEIKINPARIVKDLDSIPMPARHLLPMDKYNSVISLHPMTTMMSSRGCPFHCGFCFKGETDKVLRLRNPIKVVDEMEYVVKQYKVKEIMFYDDTFTWNKKHVEDICHEIIKRGLKIKWEAPTRVNTVTEELLELMKKAGCRRLRYGVESGDSQPFSSILRVLQ